MSPGNIFRIATYDTENALCVYVAIFYVLKGLQHEKLTIWLETGFDYIIHSTNIDWMPATRE